MCRASADSAAIGRAGQAVLEHVGGDNEVFIRVERLARTDQKVIAVVVTEVVGRQQDQIAPVLVQFAVGDIR